MSRELAIDIVGDTSHCGLDCPAFIEKWTEWWQDKHGRTMAILDCSGKYLEKANRNTRNMVSKANRLYIYDIFEHNYWLPDIDEINKSAPMRQGIPMTGWYTEPAKCEVEARLCVIHRDTWYGGFSREDGTLLAFCKIACMNNIGVMVSILGHAGYGAVINGLIAYMADNADVQWINYLHMQSKTESLTKFKERLGFEPTKVTISDL